MGDRPPQVVFAAQIAGELPTHHGVPLRRLRTAPLRGRAGHTRASMSYGAELDGSRLSVVEMVHGAVRSITVHEVDGVAEAADVLRACTASSGRSVASLVSWAGPGVAVRRTGLHAESGRHGERAVVDAARTALDRLLPAGGSLPGAAVLHTAERADSRLATVGAVTGEMAAEFAAALAGSGWRLVGAPMVLRHDGLHLAIRRSTVELSLVRAGAVEVSRQMRSGGLAAAATGEAHGSPLASRALEDLDESTDSHAATVARRFVASLAREVHRTVQHWERSGIGCPREVWVHGPGATLPNVPTFLDSVGFAARPAPIGDTVDVRALGEVRLAAYGALCAAVAASGDLGVRRDVRLLTVADAPRARWSSGQRTLDPLAGFEGVVSGSGERSFLAPRVRGAHHAESFAGAGALTAAIAVAALFGVVGWWQVTRSLDESTEALRSADHAETAALAQREWALDVAVAAADLRSISSGATSGWDVALGRLLSASPDLPPVDVIELTEGEPGSARVVARLVVTEAPTAPVDDALLVRWEAALGVLGDVEDVRRVGASEIEFILSLDVAPTVVTGS